MKPLRMSTPLFAVCGLVIGAGVAARAGPATRPADPSTSRPAAVEGVSRESIDRLARALGSPRFKARQAAQRQLQVIGEAATPFLLPYISDPNPEIAGRVASLIRTPSDPELRVELAWRLLTTTNPDWMERAVHIVFEEPAETCDLFLARAKNAAGIDRVVSGPVVDWLEQWRKDNQRIRRQYEKTKRRDPAAAARLLDLQSGTNLYLAEAAYWEALEALLERTVERDAKKPETIAASRPTSRSAP